MNSFYSQEELLQLGLKDFGNDVRISKKTSFYGIENITIGDHVRIDDFCILSGNITIQNYIHIAAGTLLYGGCEGIELQDFCNISSRVAIYAVSDDYSGTGLTNPMVSDSYKQLINEKVTVERHAIIGSGCTILPGVTLGEGSAFGAMSLINKTTEKWGIYMGIPAKKIKDRKKEILELEKKFLKEESRKSDL